MRKSLHQLCETVEDVFGALYSGGFMVLWLFCWPLYRFVRSHTVRG
jgi:hypothetical protein